MNKLSFKTDLWDGFSIVTKSENSGLNFYKDVYNYFRRRAAIEEEYAKNLQKLQHKTFERKDTISELNVARAADKEKMEDSSVEGSAESFSDAWLQVERAAHVEAQAHTTFSAAILELIVEPAKLSIRDCEERLKALQTDGQRIASENQLHLKNVEKARANYQKLNSEVEAARASVAEATKEKSKEASKLDKKLQKAVQEAEVAGTECRSLEAEANTNLKTFHSDLMPRVLEDLEKLTSTRSSAMSAQLQKYISLLEEVPKRVSFIVQSVSMVVGAVNVEGELVTSTSAGKSKYWSLAAKITTNFKTMRSNTNTSPKPIPNFMAPTSPTAQATKSGSIFGMKLDEMMRRQATTAPSLEIPVPLVVLAHAILHQNGATAEGIFRIPSPSSELQRLIKQFDEGNFVIDFNATDPTLTPSVHCLAAALKKLLRESPDSLIPGSSYDRAIAISQGAEHESAAQHLVAALPAVNRQVTIFLIRFLQEFLHPDCVARSKMTLDNISMVFAPTVLRSPSEDLNIMVANSLHEKAFVRLLLETQPSFSWWALPGENPPPNLSADLTNSPRLTLDVLQSMLDPISLSFTPSLTPTGRTLPAHVSSPALTSPLSLSSSLSLSPSQLPSTSPDSPLASDVARFESMQIEFRSRSLSLSDFANGDESAPIPIPNNSWY